MVVAYFAINLASSQPLICTSSVACEHYYKLKIKLEKELAPMGMTRFHKSCCLLMMATIIIFSTWPVVRSCHSMNQKCKNVIFNWFRQFAHVTQFQWGKLVLQDKVNLWGWIGLLLCLMPMKHERCLLTLWVQLVLAMMIVYHWKELISCNSEQAGTLGRFTGRKKIGA